MRKRKMGTTAREGTAMDSQNIRNLRGEESPKRDYQDTDLLRVKLCLNEWIRLWRYRSPSSHS